MLCRRIVKEINILNPLLVFLAHFEVILCHRTLNGSQDTDVCVFVDAKKITGQIAAFSGQT